MGQNKAVAIAITGAGSDIGNYSYNTTGSATATIDPKAIQVTLVGPIRKKDDGSTIASLAPSNFEVSGLASGEAITVTQTVGQYSGGNPGPVEW